MTETTVNNSGVFTDSKSCLACAAGSYPGPNNRPIYQCAACPFEGHVYTTTTVPWTCACNTNLYTSSAGRCLNSTDVLAVSTVYPVETAYTVNYQYVETSTGSSLGQVGVSMSDTYNYLYYDAAVGCQVYDNP